MSEFKQTWNESFKNYAIDIARIFVHEPEHIINCLKFDSVCGSLNETYLALVREKEIDPLEILEHNEKLRIWDLAKTLSNREDKCVLISRSIYLLEKLTR
jgi:hypothetical protein